MAGRDPVAEAIGRLIDGYVAAAGIVVALGGATVVVEPDELAWIGNRMLDDARRLSELWDSLAEAAARRAASRRQGG